MVTLLDGTMQLGQQPLDASGSASFSLTSLTVGPHSLMASYPGDAVYGASTSPVLNQTVSDFTPSLAMATQTVAAGSSASYSLAIAPVAGFKGSVTFTCSGLPSYASCSAPPTNVAGSAATTTITVATGSNALAAEAGQTGSLLYACVFGGGFWLLLRRAGVRRTGSCGLFSISVLLLAAGAIGCGSSKAPQSSPQPTSQTSMFTINVTATQNGVTVTHSVAATLVTHS